MCIKKNSFYSFWFEVVGKMVIIMVIGIRIEVFSKRYIFSLSICILYEILLLPLALTMER